MLFQGLWGYIRQVNSGNFKPHNLQANKKLNENKNRKENLFQNYLRSYRLTNKKKHIMPTIKQK